MSEPLVKTIVENIYGVVTAHVPLTEDTPMDVVSLLDFPIGQKETSSPVVETI